MSAITDRVREEYPTLAFLLNDREIGKLLTEAVDPNKGFSLQTFQGKLYQTRWWRTRSQSQREWEITRHTDPGEAKRRRREMYAAIRAQAAAFGTSLNGKQIRSTAERMLSQGASPDGPEMANSLAMMWDWKDRGRGAVAEARRQSLALARQYFDSSVGERTRAQRGNLDARALRVASGKDTLEAQQSRMQASAMKRFGHMSDQLALGMTPYEIVDPYRKIVAEEMGYTSSDRVNLNNPVWRQLLGVRDPKTKKMRMLTEADTIRLARSQTSWWQGPNGKTADNAMAQSLLRIFGQRGGAS